MKLGNKIDIEHLVIYNSVRVKVNFVPPRWPNLYLIYAVSYNVINTAFRRAIFNDYR